MEISSKILTLGTPMNPLPNQVLSRRLPPRILPFRYKIKDPKAWDLRKAKINSEIDEFSGNLKDNAISPKLPIISIKKHNFKINNKPVLFTKYPKFQNYKPLFHDRNKSYPKPSDDEEYLSMRNQISLLDY